MHSYTNPRTALPLPPKHRQMLQPRPTPTLDAGYVLTDRAAVLGFLAQRPAVAGYLADVSAYLMQFFPTAQLRLSVIADPEGESTDHMALAVVTELAPRDALAQLRAFEAARRQIRSTPPDVHLTLRFA